MTKPTTPTAYGPAEYHVHEDGAVSLTWPQGVTIHRVRYTSASLYGEKRGDRHTGTVTLERERWQEKATDSARSALRAEHARLAPLLATPHAMACARLDNAAWAAYSASEDLKRAQAKAAAAVEAEAEARATLTALEHAAQDGAA